MLLTKLNIQYSVALITTGMPILDQQREHGHVQSSSKRSQGGMLVDCRVAAGKDQTSYTRSQVTSNNTRNPTETPYIFGKLVLFVMNYYKLPGRRSGVVCNRVP